MNAATAVAIGEALDNLLGAFALSPDDAVSKDDKQTIQACCDAIYDAIMGVENAFCLSDAQAYRAWAERFAKEYDCDVEPCDAWFEGENGPWIDGWIAPIEDEDIEVN